MLTYEQIADIWDRHGVFDLLTAKYKAEVAASFDWDGIHAELDEGEFIANEYELENGYDDEAVSTLFLGTVFALTPSGKYYTPWACSNVTPKEALKDEAWQEAFEAVMESHDLFATGGEGDPCDIFICKHIDLPDEDDDPEVADAILGLFFNVLTACLKAAHGKGANS